MYLGSVIREKCVGIWNECVRVLTDRFFRTLLVCSVRYSRCRNSSVASASVILCDEYACFSYVYHGICVNYFTGICNSRECDDGQKWQRESKEEEPFGIFGIFRNSYKSRCLMLELWGKGHIRTKCPKKAKRKQPGGKGKEQEAHMTQASDNYAFSLNIVGEALSWRLNEGTSS